MRKLKSLENFSQGLAPEKTRMFQGGEDEVEETFVSRRGTDDWEFAGVIMIVTDTYVERNGDRDIDWNQL